MEDIKPDTYRYILSQIRVVDEDLTREIERRLVSIGINRKVLNEKSLLLGTFIVNAIRLMKTFEPSLNYLRSSWMFMKRSGDIIDIENYLDEDRTYVRLLSLPDLSKINEELIRRIAGSIKIYAQALIRTKNVNDLNEFSTQLGSIVEKAYHIRLDDGDSVKLLRESLVKLFMGSERLADLYVYIAVRVLGLWPESRRSLRPVITAKMLRPLREMELATSEDEIYSMGKKMFPDDPSIVSMFNMVATRWCKAKKKECLSCPFYLACPKL